MAHVQDLWEKTVAGRRVRTSRYGKGNRWQARYLDPEGQERTRTFARKQDAERFVVTVRADVLRGAYVDPDAGKVTSAAFAERWLAAQTFDESSREATELRLRRHASRHFGHRELRSIKPSVIQAWLRKLQQERAPSYVRTVFTNVSSVLNAAVDDGLITSNPCRAGSVKLPKRQQRKSESWPVERVEAVLAALPDRYRAVGSCRRRLRAPPGRNRRSAAGPRSLPECAPTAARPPLVDAGRLVLQVLETPVDGFRGERRITPQEPDGSGSPWHVAQPQNVTAQPPEIFGAISHPSHDAPRAPASTRRAPRRPPVTAALTEHRRNERPADPCFRRPAGPLPRCRSRA